MKFSIDEIPENQLGLLGLERKDILSLPKKTKDALLSGNRTSLMRFDNLSLPGIEGKIPLDAKISLARKPDGSVSLRIHPVNKQAKNVFGLSEEEQEVLKKEEAPFVSKTLRGNDGKVKNVLISLDRETNEYVAVDREKIVAPKKVAGVELTPEQQQDFREGKEVEAGDETIRLDTNTEEGISGMRKQFRLPSIEFSHSKYTSNELAIDIALLTMGLGHVMMIGHLANLLVSTVAKTLKSKTEQNSFSLRAENKSMRDTLARMTGKIRENIEKGTPLKESDLSFMAGNGEPSQTNGRRR